MGDIPPRTNGFQRPYNKHQIISWVIIGLEALTSVLAFVPPLSTLLKIVIGILLLILKITLLIVGYRATKIDPSDDQVEMQRSLGNLNESLGLYCTLCRARVGERTKHCGKCNRCVEVFDHHCVWLNNCVGRKNYRMFLVSVWSLFLLANLKIVLGGYLIHKYFADYDDFVIEVFKIVESLQAAHAILGMIIASLVINMIVWLLFSELVFLHIWLSYHKMTTYEYILQRRERKNQAMARKEAQSENNSHRMQSPTATRKEQNHAYKSKIIVKVDEAAKISGQASNLSVPADNSYLGDLEQRENPKNTSSITEANSFAKMQGEFKVNYSANSKKIKPSEKIIDESFRISQDKIGTSFLDPTTTIILQPSENLSIKRVDSTFITTTPNFIGKLPDINENHLTEPKMSRGNSTFGIPNQDKAPEFDPSRLFTQKHDFDHLESSDTKRNISLSFPNAFDANNFQEQVSYPEHKNLQEGIDNPRDCNEKSLIWNNINELEISNIVDKTHSKLLDESFGSRRNPKEPVDTEPGQRQQT